MNTTLLLIAQASPEQIPQPPFWVQLMPFILMFAAFYFLLIGPQKKRMKEHQKMVDSLEVGDDVITVGGILGKVVGKKEKTFSIRVADNVKIEVLRSAIQTVTKQNGTTSTSPTS
jgi:preprotein translocase subunit YajC